MIEIALCIAIIGFALVAIIGVLPSAMRVQQDNREDSLVEQDGTYLLEAIRHGAQGLDDLTNYVRKASGAPGAHSPVRTVYHANDGSGNFITNDIPDPKDYDTGWKLIGLLSQPRWTNEYRVEAEFRAISGAAIEKDPNSVINFEYLLVSEVVPFTTFDATTAFGASSTNANTIGQIARNLQNNLYELRLTLRWPLSANGTVGNNRKVFRTLMSGSVTNYLVGGRSYSFLQPSTYLPTP